MGSKYPLVTASRCSDNHSMRRRQLARACAAIALAALTSCRGDYVLPPPSTTTSVAPIADAGTGSSFLVTSTITLDASGSRATTGALVSYRWTLVSSPPSTSCVPADPSAMTTSAVLDRVGTYVFQVVVTDDHGGSASSTVTYKAEAPTITIDPGADVAVDWRQTAHLSGAIQVEGGLPFIYAWSLVTVPPKSSAVLQDPDTLTPSLFADAEGTYTVELAVETAYNVASAHLTVTSSATRVLLGYNVIDAEYSSSLDRIIAVSDLPPALHILDPATATEQVVALAKTPRAVSLDPSGSRAAVGHDHLLSIINLQQARVTTTFALPFAVYDLVFGADNRVHCMHDTNNVGLVDLYTADLATHTVTDNTSVRLLWPTHARLHPSGTTMYTTYPLARYDVSGAATLDWYAPGFPSQAAGNDLWFIHGGDAYVANSGGVFASSSDRTVDMTQIAALTSYPDWAQEAASVGQLATVSTLGGPSSNSDASLDVYDDQTYNLIESILIPDTPIDGTTYKNKAKLVTYSSDDSTIYVLVTTAVESAVYPVVP